MIAIVGGMLVDGNGGPPVHDSVVVIQGEKILAAGPRGTVSIPANAKIIQAGGMTVMPGLFDLHVHLLIMGHGKYDEFFPRYRSRLRNEIMPTSAYGRRAGGEAIFTKVTNKRGQRQAIRN